MKAILPTLLLGGALVMLPAAPVAGADAAPDAVQAEPDTVRLTIVTAAGGG